MFLELSFFTISLFVVLFIVFFVGNVFLAHILFKNSPDASILRSTLAKCIFGFINATIDTAVIILVIYFVIK